MFLRDSGFVQQPVQRRFLVQMSENLTVYFDWNIAGLIAPFSVVAPRTVKRMRVSENEKLLH